MSGCYVLNRHQMARTIGDEISGFLNDIFFLWIKSKDFEGILVDGALYLLHLSS